MACTRRVGVSLDGMRLDTLSPPRSSTLAQ
eukprot:COSAG03_NODE_28819_length_193_cov_1635.414894_1_plen_29_part_10